jgi:hypothetical protein
MIKIKQIFFINYIPCIFHIGATECKTIAEPTIEQLKAFLSLINVHFFQRLALKFIKAKHSLKRFD